MLDLLRVRAALGHKGDHETVTLPAGDLRALLERYDETDDYDDIASELYTAEKQNAELAEGWEEVDGLNAALAAAMLA